MKKCRSNKGFTLVELIIVIAILAIIMLIAIPNFSGIQQRMKVRADKSTAAQIGKAVRVWYTDYTTDPVLADDIADGSASEKFLTAEGLVDYTALENITGYCSKYEPASMVDASGIPLKYQRYVVGLTSQASTALICVGIEGSTSAFSGTDATLTASADVEYNGTANAIAYIEPGEDVEPSPSSGT